MNLKTSKNIVSFVSFFLYAGYYIGILLLFIFKAGSLSRFYSIPLRLLLCLLMILFIKENFNKLKNNSIVLALLVAFSFLYFFKILYTANMGWVTSVNWLNRTFFYLSYCFFPFVFFSTVNVKLYHKQIVNALILSGFILSLLSIYYFSNQILSGSIGRIGSNKDTDESTISPLALAYSSVLTIAMCVYKLLFDTPKLRGKIYLCFVVLTSIVLFLIGSTRGALVAVMFCVLAFIYFGDAKRKLVSIFLVLISTPLVGWAIEFTGSSILDRTTKAVEEGDTSGREGLWNDAIQEFLNNPILGGRVEVSGIYPHNIFLEISMATGMIGLLIFICFLFSILYKTVKYTKLNKEYIIPILIFTCGIALHNFSGSLYASIVVFSSLGMMNFKYGK